MKKPMDIRYKGLKTVISVFVLSLVTSCNSIEKQKESRVTTQRIEFSKQQMELLSKGVNHENNSLSKRFYELDLRLEQMIKKLEDANKKQSELNLDAYCAYFEMDGLIDVSFWKKRGPVSVDQALLIFDQLLLAIERSDYCNDYYVFNEVMIDFDETVQTIEQGKLDSVKFLVNSRNSNFSPMYKIDGTSEEIKSNYLKLDASKKGEKIIKGTYMVLKGNRLFHEPFEYRYVVR